MTSDDRGLNNPETDFCHECTRINTNYIRDCRVDDYTSGHDHLLSLLSPSLFVGLETMRWSQSSNLLGCFTVNIEYR
jgi:hypothetical protein